MKLKQIRVDGYKNLINCTVDLGDFNVIVGPNNSGKSNLMEALPMLYPICFGDENLRKEMLKGLNPRLSGLTTSICHLDKHKNKPITIGISYEFIGTSNEPWIMNYDVSIKCDSSKKEDFGFISETLTAKAKSATGKPITYIKRTKEKVEIAGKKYPISKDVSSFEALKTLYPDFKNLGDDTKNFVQFHIMVILAASNSIFALSPSSLRRDLGNEEAPKAIKVSSFDLAFVFDKIKEDKNHYQLLCDTICDILEFNKFELHAQAIPTTSNKENESNENFKKMRWFEIESPGNQRAYLEEYSDGTLMVLGLLSALFSEERKGSVYCIEELENCLHPAALDKLLRFLRENASERPVIITTHSPYVLNTTHPKDVIVAVVGEDGSTQFKKVKDKKTINAILNNKYMNFGDLLETNYKDVLGD